VLCYPHRLWSRITHRTVFSSPCLLPYVDHHVFRARVIPEMHFSFHYLSTKIRLYHSIIAYVPSTGHGLLPAKSQGLSLEKHLEKRLEKISLD
jgi:hypothetical protein